MSVSPVLTCGRSGFSHNEADIMQPYKVIDRRRWIMLMTSHHLFIICCKICQPYMAIKVLRKCVFSLLNPTVSKASYLRQL